MSFHTQTYFQIPRFLGKEAKALRSVFDDRFKNPKNAAKRFVWDYWHIPNQYTLLRTDASSFFPHKTYERFLLKLAEWGKENLGCHNITPTWLSCYVDGCNQKMHADLPHGPWAFVYSLTPWDKKEFSGGETFLTKPELLSYWENLSSLRSLEYEQAFQKIPAKFDQLLVFDPRIPHGVETVRGVHDVTKGRLVIHGWFTNPHLLIEGPIQPKEVYEKLNTTARWMKAEGFFSNGASGILTFRIEVRPSGELSSITLLSNTLRTSYLSERDLSESIKSIIAQISGWTFRRKKTATTVSLPIIFDF